MTEDEKPEPRLPVDPDATVSPAEGISSRSLSLRRLAGQTVRDRWDVLLVIAVGGALGSLARWGVGETLSARPGTFPWATFIENVSGGFALGVLMVLVLGVWPRSRYARPFLGVGVLGGFTTFSTYLLDTRALVAADRVPIAAVYLFGTLVTGLAAVWLGIAGMRLVVDRPVASDGRRA